MNLGQGQIPQGGMSIVHPAGHNWEAAYAQRFGFEHCGRLTVLPADMNQAGLPYQSILGYYPPHHLGPNQFAPPAVQQQAQIQRVWRHHQRVGTFH